MKSTKAKAFEFSRRFAKKSVKVKAGSRAFRPLRGRVHFFDKRQRNEPKKTLCAQGKSGKSSSRGFFYGTSMSHRKTPHILCGALRVCKPLTGIDIFRSKSTASCLDRSRCCGHPVF